MDLEDGRASRARQDITRFLRRARHGIRWRVRRRIPRSWLRAYRAVAYRGQRFYCPCCDRTAGRFRDFRAERGTCCPWCGSLTRHRLTWLYLQREADVETAELRLLHVAPEEALLLRLKRRPNLQYVGFDLERERATDVLGDVTRAPFASGTFDLIVCSHVLEHIPADRAAMREIARLLSPKGRAVLLVPFDGLAETDEDPSVTDPRERARRFGQHDHVRMYGHDLLDRLRDSGLDVESLDYRAGLGEHERERMAIGETEPLFVCRPALVDNRKTPGARTKAQGD